MEWPDIIFHRLTFDLPAAVAVFVYFLFSFYFACYSQKQRKRLFYSNRFIIFFFEISSFNIFLWTRQYRRVNLTVAIEDVSKFDALFYLAVYYSASDAHCCPPTLN